MPENGKCSGHDVPGLKKSFGFPPLGTEREFDPIRSDEDGSDFRAGQMPDDVECLEIVAEPVVFPDRDCVKDTEVIPTVQSGRDRVYVVFLAEIECLSRERNLVHIYLGSKTAVAHKLPDSIRQSPRDEIAE